MVRFIILLIALTGVLPSGGRHPSPGVLPIAGFESHPVPGGLPIAGFEDYRAPVGRLEDGELRVSLEAGVAIWRPWGEDGPSLVANVFVADGAPPRVPGPFIRVTAGTPVRVTLRNGLGDTLVVRGLRDRSSTPPPGPPFGALLVDAVEVAPGETAEVSFTPTVPGTYWYFGSVLQTLAAGATRTPFSVTRGPFTGVLVVDPVEPVSVPPRDERASASSPTEERASASSPTDERASASSLTAERASASSPTDERIFLITHWAELELPGSWQPSVRFMINGRSWPHTERLVYERGDTVRWRVLNATGIPHPMHLHGFHFEVEARGDQWRETVHAPDERRAVVTESLDPGETMRIAFVASEPGNWVFHCHLMRHMSWTQTAALDHAAHTHDGERAGEDLLGGLVLGITVRPGEEHRVTMTPVRRRLPLHITMRARVFGDEAGYAFVLQEDASSPAPDSLRFPGSTLVLRRGEPTEIVVHNRADVPLGVHWHGLELESWADGVPGWSGSPGSVIPAIAPGDSFVVRMTPPRAGSFMYHVHSEPGHQLAQGLYGAFLVLEPRQERDAETDRLFVLGALGAGLDAPPAVNGELAPTPLELRTGTTYRLRFMHISPDEEKRLALLSGDEPVAWRVVAKDGADLPAALVRTTPAALRIHVGETYDALWTPAVAGEHTLRIVTTFASGPPGFPASTAAPDTTLVPLRVR